MKKIPLTIITGFLGSGKTTLINKILRENNGLKIALIVNEFGDVALESQFIEKTDEEVVEMSNGCMCCVVRKDIIETVQNLLKKRPDIDYIIVEASGLSDPKPIAETFAMNMTDTIRLDAILCVVDALNIEKNFQNYEIAAGQILYADIVLVSKTGMISPQKYQEIKFFVKKLNPFMRVLPIDDSLSLDVILDIEKFDYSKVEELEATVEHHHAHEEECNDPTHHHHHEHHHEHQETCNDPTHHHHHSHKHEHVDEVFVKLEKPLDMEKFSELLKHLPQEVVRGKWFLYPADEQFEGKKILFQFVGVRYDTQVVEWAKNEVKQTALVFIGKWYDKAQLEKDVRDCVK